MAVSRIDILNQRFGRALRGYDTAEVDRFVQEVADTVGTLSEEKAALASRLAELEARLAEFRARETALRDTLMTTQKMSVDIKAGAQREAQLIIDAAHAKAENLLNQGNLRLARLHEEIATARKQKAQFEMRVRSVVEQHLALLDMSEQEDAALDAAAARAVARSRSENG